MSLLCCCVFLFFFFSFCVFFFSVEAPKCPDFGTQLDCDKAALPQITPPVTPQKVLLYNFLLFILSFSFSLIYSYTHSLVCFSCLFYRSVGTRVGQMELKLVERYLFLAGRVTLCPPSRFSNKKTLINRYSNSNCPFYHEMSSLPYVQ